METGNNNVYLGVGTMVLLALTAFFLYFELVALKSSSFPDLTVIVEKSTYPIFEEIILFYKSKHKKTEIKLKTYEENNALSQFILRHNCFLFIPRKLTFHEKQRLRKNRLPLEQKLFVTGKENVPIDKLYLIKDQKDSEMETKFLEYLEGEEAQLIFFQEGFLPTRIN